MEKNSASNKWYVAGLHFECSGCGGCCSGPGEGYIWVVRKEIELIAEHLELSTEELRQRYLRRVGIRTSIIEHSVTKDCIFLRKTRGGKQCMIYPVRPNQCRTWPFWPENLSDANAWNTAALRCLGMNRGRRYSGDDIQRIKDSKRWWENPDDAADSSQK